jgi:hypothetical protein
MQQIDDFDLIDKYLRNEMSSEEASAFEKTLAHNEELRKEVEIRFDIMVGIRASEQQHILEELNKIDNQRASGFKNLANSKKIQIISNQKTNKDKSKYSIIMIVIGIIVILLLVVLFYFINNKS